MYESYTQKYVRIFLMIIGFVLIGVGAFKIYQQQLNHMVEMSQKNISVINMRMHRDALQQKVDDLESAATSAGEIFYPTKYGDRAAQLENRIVRLNDTIESSGSGTSMISYYDEMDGLTNDIKVLFSSEDLSPVWLSFGDGTWSFSTNYGSHDQIIPCLWLRQFGSVYTGYATSDFDGRSNLFDDVLAHSFVKGTIYKSFVQ